MQIRGQTLTNSVIVQYMVQGAIADKQHSVASAHTERFDMFTAPLNKSGKITATGEKNALILNHASSRAVMGVALTGKGTIATMARAHLKNQADTLDQLLAVESLDGSRWGDLLALLVAEYGTSAFSRLTMRGKVGCSTYLSAVRAAAEASYLAAETVKRQDAALATLAQIDAATTQVDRLLAVSQAEIDTITASMAQEAVDTPSLTTA